MGGLLHVGKLKNLCLGRPAFIRRSFTYKKLLGLLRLVYVADLYIKRNLL